MIQSFTETALPLLLFIYLSSTKDCAPIGGVYVYAPSQEASGTSKWGLRNGMTVVAVQRHSKLNSASRALSPWHLSCRKLRAYIVQNSLSLAKLIEM